MIKNHCLIFTLEINIILLCITAIDLELSYVSFVALCLFRSFFSSVSFLLGSTS
jgi:hypothetical protein